MSLIAKRLNLIKPSATLAVVQKSIEMKKAGVDIISLGAGEPDFDTPQNIKEAAIQGIRDGCTRYTDVAGMPELKAAIKAKFKRENDLDFETDEVMASTGGKQVIYNLFTASLDEGDEVIIPAPYWVSYPDMVLLANGIPVFAPTDMATNFKIIPQKLEQFITTKTKWLILNSPSNPTGAGYSREELTELAKVLLKYPHVYVLSDDIYEHIVFDGFKFYTLLQVAPELKDRVFTVNGVSKAYAMTGWRIGYGGGPKNLIKAMTMIQSQSTSNPSSVSQIAAIEALNGTQNFIKDNARLFQTRRDSAIELLNSIEGVKCYKPEGAFYLFPQCQGLFGRRTPSDRIINDSTTLADYLLEQAQVAVVPGSAFGLEGYFRISYALSNEKLATALNKIVAACRKLK